MANLFWSPIAWLLARRVIANWLVTRAMRTPDTHITSADGTDTYMKRYWLFNPYDSASRTRRVHWCPISIRVHHILRADQDRHLHDHPWNFRTIILMGSYIEERAGRDFNVRSTGDTVALKFGEFHRIHDIDRRMGAVTLFIMGRYRGKWGFKMPYDEYLEMRR